MINLAILFVLYFLLVIFSVAFGFDEKHGFTWTYWEVIAVILPIVFVANLFILKANKILDARSLFFIVAESLIFYFIMLHFA
ncbi:MAG TPA: hypothetical protein VKR58_10685 [Aquella sp.]|nr:hypothetical protein [Aquella sp.]